MPRRSSTASAVTPGTFVKYRPKPEDNLTVPESGVLPALVVAVSGDGEACLSVFTLPSDWVCPIYQVERSARGEDPGQYQ